MLALASTGVGGAESNILTCTTGVPPYLSCSYERIGWSLLGLEGGVGASLVVDQQNGSLANITPFVTLGYYGVTRAYWVEVTTPDGIVPLVGDNPQVINLGAEFRW